jgi:hypothetical protein
MAAAASVVCLRKERIYRRSGLKRFQYSHAANPSSLLNEIEVDVPKVIYFFHVEYPFMCYPAVMSTRV